MNETFDKYFQKHRPQPPVTNCDNCDKPLNGQGRWCDTSICGNVVMDSKQDGCLLCLECFARKSECKYFFLQGFPQVNP